VYKDVTHVTVEVVNCTKIDNSIESLQRRIDGKQASIADVVSLTDIMSILKGIKQNYSEGRTCTKHPVKLQETTKFTIDEIHYYLVGKTMMTHNGRDYIPAPEVNQSLKQAVNELKDCENGIEEVIKRRPAKLAMGFNEEILT